MATKQKKPFTRHHVLVAFGAVALLFGVLFLLSPHTRIRYVSFPITFAFGVTGFYFFAAFCIEGGLHLLAHVRMRAYSARTIVGLILLALGLWLLFSALFPVATPDIYSETLLAAYQGDGLALYSSQALSGGYLGSLLHYVLSQSVGDFLLYIIASVLLLGALLFLFFPLLRRAILAMRASHAVNSARRADEQERRREKEENDFIIEPDEDAIPSYREEEFPSASPSLRFSPQEEVKETPAPTVSSAPSTYVFAPAGGSTLPTRRSLHRAAEQTRVPDTVAGDPFPTLAPTAPQEVANPSFVGYAQTPVRNAGLKEAVFCPAGFAQEAVPPAPPVAPQTPAAPAFSTPKQEAPVRPMQPVVQEEAVERVTAVPTTPLERGAPVQNAPTAPINVAASAPAQSVPATPVNVAASTPSEPPAEEQPPVLPPQPETIVLSEPIVNEDEEEYEPPRNDPIVLAPNPSVLITPEVLAPTPEPAPAPAVQATLPQQTEDPKPPVDDDIEGPLPPYRFPDASMLDEDTSTTDLTRINEECAQKAQAINQIFADFGVGAHVTEYLVGPSITRYSITTDPGVSINLVGRVIPDLEVRLGGVPVRFVERVLGMACSALEVANETRRTVSFKEVFVALPPRANGPDLHIPFGLAIDGSLKQADIRKFPHMLVAGTSGSGKSIFAHGLLMSLVMRNRPEDLKLVLIDPKRGVEMAPYKDMPHLLCPIVKEARPAKNALKKLCDLMDERYIKFSDVGVRDIGDYNADYALPQGKKRMPYIVVFIDEFADLVGECKEISEYVLRIAQKARACGIHLIVATQRPDVKVITGTIKSNLLCRVALTVASTTDSQTILGVGGAEELYGYGDMLIDCQELSKREFTRAQGCLGKHHEMKVVCDFIRAQMQPKYDPNFINLEDEDEGSGPETRDGGYAPVPPPMPAADLRKASDEDKYQYVKSVIMTREYCSISMIQREFEVGFPRAGKILARLQQEGIVASPGDTPNNSKGCRVLVHGDAGDPASAS